MKIIERVIIGGKGSNKEEQRRAMELYLEQIIEINLHYLLECALSSEHRQLN